MWNDSDFDGGLSPDREELDWAPILPEVDESWNAHWLDTTFETAPGTVYREFLIYSRERDAA